MQALKRAGYRNQRKLRDAIQRQASKFDNRTVRLSLAYWQQLYEEDEDKIGALALLDRLLVIVRQFIPAYSENLDLLLNPETFEAATGVGPSCPVEMRLSMAEAFLEWLELGSQPRTGRDELDLGGTYEAYFPWFEGPIWTGSIARAEARILYDNDRQWAFESFCHVEGTRPVHFAGRLRFTGERSVVLVGFTSLTLPVFVAGHALRPGREMLLHPYRLPAGDDGWWHGSTTFIDVKTSEYAGTVGHVMRRSAKTLPDEQDWRRGIQQPTVVLRHGDHAYEHIRNELMECTVTRIGL